VRTPAGEVSLTSRLVGTHNLENLLLALGIAHALDLDVARAAEALSNEPGAPGRLERCDEPGDDVMALVDYAHTPDALEKALAAARTHCPGKLHLVFGCGGDRDALKRPIMGRIAAAGADSVTVTDDNPRTEDPARIVRDILAGIGGEFTPVRVEHDRAAAIRAAILGAAVDDLVLIAGKGHEDYQIYGTARRDFSDAQVARGVLESRA
jgi:UDP-N-acetylmuramoyl-L-alanyl-D-glutamate--2,6-diaminopimelate ligase